MESLRTYVKSVQDKKKLQLAFKIKYNRKVQEDPDEKGKGGVYEEGKGYLHMNTIDVEKLPHG